MKNEMIKRVVSVFTFFVLSYFMWGCAPVTKAEIVYRDVKVLVPVSCVEVAPTKPQYINDVVKMNLLIMQYAKELELIVAHCIEIGTNYE